MTTKTKNKKVDVLVHVLFCLPKILYQGVGDTISKLFSAYFILSTTLLMIPIAIFLALTHPQDFSLPSNTKRKK